MDYCVTPDSLQECKWAILKNKDSFVNLGEFEGDSVIMMYSFSMWNNDCDKLNFFGMNRDLVRSLHKYAKEMLKIE